MSNAGGKMVKLVGWVAAGLMLAMSCAVAASAAHAPIVATTATASSAKTHVVGDFEGKPTTSKQYGTYVLADGKGQGWGWAATADKRAGGQSSATVALVHPGAAGTHGALAVSGELKSGFIAPFAGAVWFPGSHPMQKANLSGYTTLTFWARGKPGNYSIMLMAGATPGIPQSTTVRLTKDWKQYSIPLASSFPGADLKQVFFIAFSAGAFGKIKFELDQVALH